jgi:ATP-binding cassette subfamily B protein
MKQNKKLNYLRSPMSTFWYAIYPYRYRYSVMLVLIIIGNIFSYSLPYIFKLITDRIVNFPGQISMADLMPIFIWIPIVLIMQEVCFRLGHILETYITPEAFKHLTTSLYNGLIKRPTSYFENKFSGDLGRRIEQIGSSIVSVIESPWEFGWMIMSILASAVILGYTNILVLATFLVWTVFFLATSIPILVLHKRASEKVAESHASLSGSIIDTISNIPLVQSFGGVTHEQSQNERMTYHVVKTERKMRWLSVLDKFQCGLSITLLGTALTYVCIYLFTKGEFTVGDFVLVTAVIPSVVSTVWSSGGIIAQQSRNYGQLTDAVAALREKQEQLIGGDILEVSTPNYSVEFKNLYFQYPDTSAPVFENLSLSIKQGQRVGIVGSSGAGKSTLMKLLLRQHEFGKGAVTIGDISVRDFDLNAFHKLVSYVPQDTSLFHRTLFENIKYAKMDASDEEVYTASRKANAEDFIKSFPSGYGTMVGERGVKLSGGQRQRIALARAILKNAPILVLDEATSSLDTESESSIQDALSKLFTNRTVIAIAHRLSTLRAMDRIVVIENGEVVEDGAPQDLLQKEGSVFKKMWDHQKDGFIT